MAHTEGTTPYFMAVDLAKGSDVTKKTKKQLDKLITDFNQSLSVERKPVTHYVKSHHEYFAQVSSGENGTQVRRDDRDYQKGDTLCLLEFDPVKKKFCGSMITTKITCVIRNMIGVKKHYAVLSIEIRSNYRSFVPRLAGAEEFDLTKGFSW